MTTTTTTPVYCMTMCLPADWFSRTIKIQLSVLIYYKADLINISLKINLFSRWLSCKIGVKQQSLTHYFIQGI